MSESLRVGESAIVVTPERRRADRRERQQKSLCPHCGHWDSVVMQGWPDPRGYTRRRRCEKCGQTFKTREVAIIGKIGRDA